jgi:hypothetical protein
MVFPRLSPSPASHFYCRTSAGAKLLYDRLVHEEIEPGSVIRVTYVRSSRWAIPDLATSIPQRSANAPLARVPEPDEQVWS